MQRSHSRESFPLDKPLPKMRGYHRLWKQAMGNLHNTKQRQHNKRLIKEASS